MYAKNKVAAYSLYAGSTPVPSRWQIEEEEGTEAHWDWMTGPGYAKIQL